MTVTAPNGSVRWTGHGYFSGEKVIIEDVGAVIFAGDDVRRRLPNGHDDVWTVRDPKSSMSVASAPITR
jgi:hypothetical protein